MSRKLGKDATLKLLTPGLKQKETEDKMNRAMHQRGYELWRAGVSPVEIQKRLHISRKTWDWLLKEGCRQLVSYEDLVINEVSSIRNAASEAAIEVSSTSVKVLRDRMANAGTANGIMADILAKGADGITEIDAKVLRAILPIANITTVAEAFARIYGTSAATRGLHPTVDHSKAEYIQPLEIVQGKRDEKKALMPAEQRDQVVSDVAGWSQEQLDKFIAEGNEPPPSEVEDT